MIKNISNNNNKNKNINVLYKNNFSNLKLSKQNIINIIETNFIKKPIIIENKLDFQVNLNNNNDFSEYTEISKFEMIVGKNKFIKDIMNNHFSVKTKIEIKSLQNNFKNNYDMYSVLTSKKSHKDELGNIWNTEKISNNQIIPTEYINWYNRNLDHLEILKFLDPEKYKEKLIEKLIEIYTYQENNIENISQNISKNPLIDIIGNSFKKNDLEEFKEIAIKFYLKQNEESIKKNIEFKTKLIENIFNYNLDNISDNFCLKLLNNYDTLTSIVHVATKGAINIY